MHLTDRWVYGKTVNELDYLNDMDNSDGNIKVDILITQQGVRGVG